MKKQSRMWAEVIRPAMIKQKIFKQKSLAEKAGVSKATIINLKYHPERVLLDTTAKVAGVLKVNIALLIMYRERQ